MKKEITRLLQDNEQRARTVEQRATVTKLTSTLHTILDTPHVTYVPGLTAGTSVTVLHAIFHKYTPANVSSFSTGEAIRTALATRNLSVLDMPLLIYVTRNWIVHGAMMDGAFGSMPRFRTYIDTVVTALSEIHLAVSQTFRARI